MIEVERTGGELRVKKKRGKLQIFNKYDKNFKKIQKINSKNKKYRKKT